MKLTDDQVFSLAMFALDILGEFPDMMNMDGGDIQDIATTRKLLTPVTVYEPCCDEGCECAICYTDDEWQKGVTCYRIVDWLARAAELPLERITPIPETAPECRYHYLNKAAGYLYCHDCGERFLP